LAKDTPEPLVNITTKPPPITGIGIFELRDPLSEIQRLERYVVAENIDDPNVAYTKVFRYSRSTRLCDHPAYQGPLFPPRTYHTFFCFTSLSSRFF
jgi:hypothetical protein